DGRDRGHRQYRHHALLPFCSLPPPPSYHHHIMQRNTPAIQPRHVEDLQPDTEPRIWNSSFGVEGPLRPVRSENLQSLCDSEMRSLHSGQEPSEFAKRLMRNNCYSNLPLHNRSFEEDLIILKPSVNNWNI
ncbi:hypothetical protein AVEN_251876-1, partial [Araneus ventricosus]